MFEATVTLRIRYAETDQMGFAYYGNYATYYEVARVEALRAMGYSYKEIEDEGILMPVLENYSKFHLPARYDELITIKVSLPKMPGVKSVFKYLFYNENQELIHEGETILAFISRETGKPCRPPAKLVEVLKPLYHD